MPLVTEFPVRQHDVSLEDFKSSSKLRFNSTLNTVSNEAQQAANFWNDREVPIEPENLLTIFSSDNFSEVVVTETFVGVAVTAHFASGGRHEKQYDLSTKKLIASKLQTNNPGQGVGTDSRMRFAETDVAFGLRQSFFGAGDTVGGYALAKAAYYLHAVDQFDEMDIRFLSHRILFLLETVKDFLPPDVFNALENHARLESEDDLYHLVNVDFDLKPFLQKEGFQSFGKRLSETIQKQETRLSISDQLKRAKTSFDFSQANNTPLTLGRLALVGSGWPAKVNYEDTKQVKRIAAYGGGFKCSNIIDSHHHKVAGSAMKCEAS